MNSQHNALSCSTQLMSMFAIVTLTLFALSYSMFAITILCPTEIVSWCSGDRMTDLAWLDLSNGLLSWGMVYCILGPWLEFTLSVTHLTSGQTRVLHAVTADRLTTFTLYMYVHVYSCVKQLVYVHLSFCLSVQWRMVRVVHLQG